MSSADARRGETSKALAAEKHTWSLPADVPRFDEVGRLLLPLCEEDFRAHTLRFKLDGRAFFPKAEHHITLIGSDLAARVAASPGAREVLDNFLATRPEECNWRYKFEPGYFMIGKEPPATDLSIVAMLSLPDAEALYIALDAALGKGVTRPPLHVTLYTSGDPRGIAISSNEMLKSRLRADLGKTHPAETRAR